jgi:hypothetical protein
VKILSVGANQITSLRYLPVNLIELKIDDNLLTSLKYISKTIKKLSCGNNKLKSLMYTPNVDDITYWGNPLKKSWKNLTIDEIKTKSNYCAYRKAFHILAKVKNKQQKHNIFRTWVSYFDTPNADGVAKQALLIFKQLASS